MELNSQFREVENSFQVLRRQFREREISRREFIDQLKKLRIRDSRGHFWMIGAQTGKWYFFDGKEWVQAEPPVSEEIKKVKCFACGLENMAGVEYCQRCGESLKEKEPVCLKCGAKLASIYQKCPICNPQPEAPAFAEAEVFKGREHENFIFRRLNPLSLSVFSGGTGLILGIICGAFAGASDYYSGLAERLPEFLATLHGTLMGGIIFAALGGVMGFFVLAALGYLEALLFNGIASIVGGFKVAVEKAGEEGEETKPE
jgi:hypothetical protein